MECIVFSTSRQIRDFVAQKEDTLLPKLYTMEEFVRRAVVVEGRAFVDDDSRVLYLYRAIGDLDIAPLGFEKEFLSFLENSPFLFAFLEEVFAEQVKIGDLRFADTYADFEDHLSLLERIYENYAKELEKDGLVDRITISEYRLNDNFLKEFSRIDIYVDGYLSRFETGLLDRIERPLYIHFAATPFNKKLIERLGAKEDVATGYRYVYDWNRKDFESLKPMKRFDPESIEAAAFSERIDQVAFVLKSVERFVEDGADPGRIAVIVPDESFAEYLKLFDEAGNFNYAMGTPFTHSGYYRRLADLYDALSGRSEIAKEKADRSGLAKRFAQVKDFDSFIDFLDGLEVSPREHETIDETKYLFGRLAPLLNSEPPLSLLDLWLRRIGSLKLDDVGGGKITVMGVLESRGKSFDGTVIVDFNEDTVPKTGENDLFLNSSIRAHAGMPTRRDKENLQKNYYYLLMLESERVALCYTENEESMPSRFLKELGIGEASAADSLYRPVIAPQTREPNHYSGVIEGPSPFLRERRVTPTKLKDFLVCARRFYYRYVLNISDDTPGEENIGTLIHSSLEAAAGMKERFISLDDYFGFVMDHLYKNASSAMQRLELSISWQMRLERFCESDFDTLKSATQPVVEDWCSVEFEGFTISSKIDRVDVLESKVRLIDYKTSKNLKELLEDENDFQLLFYRLWAESVYPDKEIETIYWDLYDSKEIPVDTSNKDERLEELLRSLIHTGIQRFDMTDDESACSYCDYKIACGR